MIELPTILQMPEKLLPFILKINGFRYFLAEGGRGGGKSQAIARIFLYLAEQRKLRMVCGRETQNSISESVYSLLCDIIRSEHLAFDIQQSKIIHKETESVINFRGFRQQGAFNIQGMEGVDVLWIDEAQAITKQTLDVLIPTIRKDKAKIYFTMNRHMEYDPVYEFCKGREDCCHVNINYDENPFCTQALKDEAAACKDKSEKDYLHIWKGEPLLQLEDSVFTYKEIKDTLHARYPMREGYGYRVAGFDVARYGDDKCAAVIIQQMGALHWEMVYADQWDHKDLNYTSGRILATAMDQHADRSVIDEDGLGAGPLDTIRHGRGIEQFIGFRNLPLGWDKNKAYGNVRTAAVYKLKELITNGHICITDEDTIRELCTLKYAYDHYQRKILVSKDQMRQKFQLKSPNLADALVMAISQIGEINYEQAEMYQTRQPQYSKEANLFSNAGVR
jgi:phage terminase large subunit